MLAGLRSLQPSVLKVNRQSREYCTLAVEMLGASAMKKEFSQPNTPLKWMFSLFESTVAYR